MSMISAGELGNIQERETPPYSPRTTVEGVVVTITAPVEGKVFYQKIMMPSDEAIQAMDSEVRSCAHLLYDGLFSVTARVAPMCEVLLNIVANWLCLPNYV